jgi:hypothetical protein
VKFLFSRVMNYDGRVACGTRRQAFNKPGITVKTRIFALPTLHRDGVANGIRAAFCRARYLVSRKIGEQRRLAGESGIFGAGGMPTNTGRA